MTNQLTCGNQGPWNWVCRRRRGHIGWHSCLRDGVHCEWLTLPDVGLQASENGEPVEVPA